MQHIYSELSVTNLNYDQVFKLVMKMSYQGLLLLFHLYTVVILILISNGEVVAFSLKEQLFQIFPNARYINYGDEVTLYNVDHQAPFVLYKDDDNTYTEPRLYQSQQNKSMFESAVEFDRDATFAVFKIQGADKKHERINDSDTIQFQSIHVSTPLNLFANDGNGVPIRILDSNPNNQTMQLLDGSEFELPTIRYIDDGEKDIEWQRWKIFITDRTLVNKIKYHHKKTLDNRISKIKKKHESDLSSLNSKLTSEKQQCEEKMTQLKSEMNHEKESIEKELRDVENDLLTQLLVANQKIEAVSDEKQSCEQELDNIRTDLTAKLFAANQTITDIKNQTNKTLTEANQTLAFMHNQVNQTIFAAGKVLLAMKSNFSKLNEELIQQMAVQFSKMKSDMGEIISSLKDTIRNNQKIYNKNFTNITGEKEKCEQELKEVKIRLKNENHRKAELKQNLTQTQDDLAAADQKTSKYAARSGALKQQMSAKEAELQDKLFTVMHDAENQLNAANKEIDRWQRKAQHCAKELNQREGELTRLTTKTEKEITSLKYQLENTKQKKDRNISMNINEIKKCQDELRKVKADLQVAKQTIIDLKSQITNKTQTLAHIQNQTNQTLYQANKTVADLKFSIKQLVLKLNASQNNTAVSSANQMKQQTQLDQQLYQLNQTFLQSESDYQINLQTKQTTINNLIQQTRNLERVVLGSFIAFGILSFAFLITCIRNATKTNKQKLILNSLTRGAVTKHMPHEKDITDKLPPTVEGSQENDYEKLKKYSINKNCCDVSNTNEMIKNNVVHGETDIGLDVVQGMINNHVKPSFMVRTQDGN